ncbi:MAG: anti-sigma factor family protein [Muricoprocola sp.]
MDCKRAQHAIMPYIEQRLSDAELEEFLEHVSQCETCREELEVYFTIYYALAKLDQDDSVSFDIKQVLKDSIEKSEEHLQYVSSKKFVERVLLVIFGIVIGIFLITGIDAVSNGGIKETKIYHMLGLDVETENLDDSSVIFQQVDESIEMETNRRNQVIIREPETEAMREEVPPPLPDPTEK